MQTTVQQNNAIPPIWWQLKNLSNKDKQTLITLLQESMEEPSKVETFEEAFKRAVTLEEFSKLCDEEIDRVYANL